MKKITLLVALTILFSCQKSIMEKKTSTNFYVGTYTNGDSKGIYKYQINFDGKLKEIGLMAATNNPSFLAKTKDGKTLLAVDETNENGTGFVKSFAIEKDTLKFINSSKSGGAHPCFIAVNEENKILVANYSGGNIGYLRANNQGKLSDLLNVQQHFGKGTTERQKKPHAHSAWFHPTKKEIISVDLGTNELWFSTIDERENTLIPSKQNKLKMADGAGPRHLTFHPTKNFIYILNELNNTVSLVKEKDEKYYIDATISMLPKGFTSYSKAADIHITKDGKFLYASNRGHESIVIYSVNAKNGSLKLVGFESVKGKNPRNFSLSKDDKFLLVANQDTNNIVCFKRDSKTGKLTFVDEIVAFNPVCVLF